MRPRRVGEAPPVVRATPRPPIRGLGPTPLPVAAQLPEEAVGAVGLALTITLTLTLALALALTLTLTLTLT